MKLNKLKLVFSLIVFQSLFFSCQEKESYEEVWKSSHPRIVSLYNHLNISDLENAKIEFTVEFYDEDQGERVSSYEWKVEHEGKAVEIGTAEKDDFVIRPETGLPAVTFEWNFTEVLEVLELDYKEVKDDAVFLFTGTLKRDDGLSFTHNGNNNGDPNQSMFEGFYRFEAELVCGKNYSGKMHEVTNFTTNNTIVSGLGYDGEMEWLLNEDGFYELKYEKAEQGIKGLVNQFYDIICLDHLPDYFTIMEDCNKLSINSICFYDITVRIFNINVEESKLEIDWNIVDDTWSTIADGKTSWTRLDGKDWSPDLFFEL